MTAETVRAWWFEPQSGVLGHCDGRKPEVGVTHKIDGSPVLCRRGFHGSLRLLDALKYAYSSFVWITEHGGEIDYGPDKLVSTERTYVQRIDLSEVLPAFARWAALQVAHLWNPSEVVLEFLRTGKEELREKTEAEAAGWVAEAAEAAEADADADADAARAVAADAAEAAGWAAAAEEGWAAAGWAAAGAGAAAAEAAEAQNTELERLALLAAGEGAFDDR